MTSKQYYPPPKKKFTITVKKGEKVWQKFKMGFYKGGISDIK